ncbi:MAG: putative lipid II flippase FtsW [bacterium]|nr:putative lipid II flippase FtsW [bacterium]
MSRARLIKQRAKIDRGLLVVVLVLTFIGFVAVADVSAPQALSVFGDRYYFTKQQLVWVIIGLVALFASSVFNYKIWSKITTPLFLFNLLLLILVLIPGVGVKVLGARRWISIGSFYFQPSELAKLSTVLFMAKFITTKKASLYYLIPPVLVSGLIMLEPDLGTTLIVAVAAMAQIFVSNLSIWHFLMASLGGGLSVFLLIITSPYRKQRLLTFFETTTDPLGRSYHIRQILLALGSGGFFGIGLSQSRQKYLFLPEAATDSIFAVIGEEMGFLGALVIISLFVFFIYKCFMIVKSAPDDYSKILALGLTVWLGGQAILNMGSVVAIFPLTGIPLPFISYGGSSLVTALFATGILLNISRYAK